MCAYTPRAVIGSECDDGDTCTYGESDTTFLGLLNAQTFAHRPALVGVPAVTISRCLAAAINSTPATTLSSAIKLSRSVAPVTPLLIAQPVRSLPLVLLVSRWAMSATRLAAPVAAVLVSRQLPPQALLRQAVPLPHPLQPRRVVHLEACPVPVPLAYAMLGFDAQEGFVSTAQPLRLVVLAVCKEPAIRVFDAGPAISARPVRSVLWIALVPREIPAVPRLCNVPAEFAGPVPQVRLTVPATGPAATLDSSVLPAHAKHAQSAPLAVPAMRALAPRRFNVSPVLLT